MTLRLLFSILLFGLVLDVAPAHSEETPNFIVIFCDDLGYGDIGPFGSGFHRTPNLDRMAKDGMKFTHFYSTCGVCSPSRASLLTGAYPKRIGMHQNEEGKWVLFPGNKQGLNPSEITIAELLKEKGYATACVGKWHLGDQLPFLPTKQGFDSYFGIPFSNDMGMTDRPKPYKYPPLPFLQDDKVIEEEPDQHFLTKRYTEKAIEFIRENKDDPFFLYLPHTMPHWPQYASPQFAGRSANGAWGDTVEEIDWSTGQILDLLDELNLSENTMVVFTSDNGGAANHGAINKPLSGAKGSTMEGGQRVCMLTQWKGRIPAGSECAEISSTLDILPTFAALAGTEPPQDRVLDGKDITPLLTQKEGAKSEYEAFYYYKLGSLEAVRSGQWKLHLPASKLRGIDRSKYRLYNVVSDPGESENVVSENESIVNQLKAFATKARTDLGDDFTKAKGSRLRPPGMVENGVTLTELKN
ncbi:sulfatase [Verrucomicrobiales bacterium]|nr:sulfatase [Verrucomicrobiales bacterium]